MTEDVSYKIRVNIKDKEIFENICERSHITKKKAFEKMIVYLPFVSNGEWVMVEKNDYTEMLGGMSDEAFSDTISRISDLIESMIDNCTMDEWIRITNVWAKILGREITFVDNFIYFNHGLSKRFSELVVDVFTKKLTEEKYEVLWCDVTDNHVGVKVNPSVS